MRNITSFFRYLLPLFSLLPRIAVVSLSNIPVMTSTPSSTIPVTDLRVVTYNVLSSHLASPDHFTQCDPNNLDIAKRIPKVLDKLEKEIEKDPGVILCLQEVSYTWASQLHTFFANRSYHMITGLYGKRFNNYMGVALAYPTTRFETLDVDITRLSDHREGGWPREPPRNDGIVRKLLSTGRKIVIGTLENLINGAACLLWGKRTAKPPIDHWITSENRHNVFLFARLRDKTSQLQFCASTYHMPCCFYAPMVMSLHAEMVVRRLQTLAGADPYILAGDFNILPGSSTYDMITTGVLERDNVDYPTSKWGYDWCCGIKGMRSAYGDAGGEPDFTNYARIRDDDPFIGTLDYIFISEQFEVTGVDEIPRREDIYGPLPNDHEPSDHVSIGANLKLQLSVDDLKHLFV